jgi:hypothetical protein
MVEATRPLTRSTWRWAACTAITLRMYAERHGWSIGLFGPLGPVALARCHGRVLFSWSRGPWSVRRERFAAEYS